MPTVGLIALLGAFLLGRQVIVGRGKETPGDLRDLFTGLVTGNTSLVTETLARKGTDSSGDASGSVASPEDSGASWSGASDILDKVIQLGHAAKGYKLGAEGPDYYDCSGLVWKALTELGIYNGPRFTTKNFVPAMGNKIRQVTAPVAGDIVLWPNHHMGVMSGTLQCYSAMSPANGIGFASVSSITSSIGGTTPAYFRVSY